MEWCACDLSCYGTVSLLDRPGRNGTAWMIWNGQAGWCGCMIRPIGESSAGMELPGIFVRWNEWWTAERFSFTAAE